jgi:hypothetical protein
MQSTGVRTLSVGSTGDKEIRGVHLSYISLAHSRPLAHPSPSSPTVHLLPPASALAARTPCTATAPPPVAPSPAHFLRCPSRRRPRSFCTAFRATAAFSARTRRRIALPQRHPRTTTPPAPHCTAATATASPARHRADASLLLSVIEMGREKRKGKEIVVEEPARKRTRAAREAERAEMVAKAAEEQASGRARPFTIRDPSARGRGRGRGMGRVRGARATRATTAVAAAESDQSLSAAESDSDTEAEQSEQSEGQGTQESPTL